MVVHEIHQYFDLTTFCLAFIVFILVKVYSARLVKTNLPPGPLGWPFVGSLPFLFSHKGGAHCALMDLAKTHGDVFSVYLGSRLVVVLNGYDAVKEALVHRSDFFSNRPKLVVVDMLNQGKALAEANGRPWTEQRRFFMKTFRRLEMGKSSRLEYHILEECSHLVKEIAGTKGMLFNPTDLITNAVSNIICFLTFGKRFEYSDAEFRHLLISIHKMMEMVGSAGAIHFVPALKVFMRGTFKDLADKRDLVFDFERKMIEQHRRSLDHDNPRDFIDAYLIESQKRKETNNLCSFTDDAYLMGTLADLLTAGTETTATTLKWGLLYLCLHQNVQRKVHEEIKKAVGLNRLLGLSDQVNLPYLQAVIYEIQRLSSVFPLSVPHCTAMDAELYGYTIPKNTEIIPNLWSVLHDPKVWTEPDKFMPERFLDKNLEEVVKPEQFIPFSIGSRVCAGEQIGKMEMFLFLGSLLQHFRFELEEGKRTDTKPIEGLTLSPKPFKVRVKCLMPPL
ncbi:cytochrome P450 2U1-like [Glandiceps talaboti]